MKIIGLLIVAHDFKKYISKRVPTIDFTLTKIYNNNKIKIAFNTRIFFVCVYNHELQLEVWSFQVSIWVFLKQNSYMIPSVLPKMNNRKNRIKYGYVFPKANELKNWFIHGWCTKISVKISLTFIIVEINITSIKYEDGNLNICSSL